MAAAMALSMHAQTYSTADYDEECGVHYSTDQQLSNWSSTHSCAPVRLYEPQTAQECVRVLQTFHKRNKKIRAVGTALSPNGLGMSTVPGDSMLSVAGLDSIEVDVAAKTVTVGAGATVSAVLAALKMHGLTLENFSSIQEQQMAGWTQVSAHGTGISLPPADEMIVHMQLATPTEGLLSLAASDTGHIYDQHSSIHPAVNDSLFRLCRVGLGSLGVVTQLTLKCAPRFSLHEHTSASTRDSISGTGNAEHARRLQDFRHVRYMWIPYTDTVINVSSNPVPAGAAPVGRMDHPGMHTQVLCDLLLKLEPDRAPEEVYKLDFGQLRDELLDVAPLDVAHVKAVNAAEAAFWRASTGTRVDDSTNVLGFNCGGEQWVYELCFPIGTAAEQHGSGGGKDLVFVKRVLDALEQAGVPAHSPIEQRWTARSKSPMSPAFSENPDEIFSWVGIIMYLPPGQSAAQRREITAAFDRYVNTLTPRFEEYGAVPHWAKVEVEPRGTDQKAQTMPVSAAVSVEAAATNDRKGKVTFVDTLSGKVGDTSHSRAPAARKVTPTVISLRSELLKARLQKRYDSELYNSHRRALDPHNILSNTTNDTLFPAHEGTNPGPAWRNRRK